MSIKKEPFWRDVYSYIYSQMKDRKSEGHKKLHKGVYTNFIQDYLVGNYKISNQDIDLALTGSVFGEIDGTAYLLSNLRSDGQDYVRGVVLIKPYGEIICKKQCAYDCDGASETVGLISDEELIFVGGSCLHIPNIEYVSKFSHDCYHFGKVDLSTRYLDSIVEEVFNDVPLTEVSFDQKNEYRDMILYMLEARSYALNKSELGMGGGFGDLNE